MPNFIACRKSLSKPTQQLICTSRYIHTLLALFISFLLLLTSTQTHASLIKAYKPYKEIQGYASELNNYVNSADKRENYDGIKSLGQKYSNSLTSLNTLLKQIGKDFKDSENKSWASSVKGKAITVSDEAIKSAKAVEKKGSEKSNSIDELRDLQANLLDLQSAMNDLKKAHDERYKNLGNEYEKNRKKWWDESKDDRKSYDDAKKQFWSLLNEEDNYRKKWNKEENELQNQLEDFSKARADGDKNKMNDEWREVSKERRDALEYHKKLEDKKKASGDAYIKMQNEWDKFVKETVESSKFYNDKVYDYAMRRIDFAAEYKP